MDRVRQYILNEDIVVKEGDIKSAVVKFMKFKEIVGNIGNDIHYLTMHLANSFLRNKHGLNIDLNKPSGSSGLDIEAQDLAAEIKTTIPHKLNDFGAAQKREIKKDLERLEFSSKKHRYFFVVDNNTERILRSKYARDYPSVYVVNLLKDD